MANDFEDVADVDVLAALEAPRDLVTVRLVLDVVEQTLLAGRVPTSRHGLVDHRLFCTDGTLVDCFVADLFEDVGAEVVIGGGIVCGGREALDERLEVHVVCQSRRHVSGHVGFLLVSENFLVADEQRMAARLPKAQNLREDGGERLHDGAGLHVIEECPLGVLEDVVVDCPLRLGEFDLDNLDVFGWKRDKELAVGSLHVLGATHDEWFENRLDDVKGTDKVFGLEGDSDEGPPEGKVVPWLNAQEADETEEIFQAVDDGSSSQDPAVFSGDLVACSGCLGLTVLDVVCFVQDDAEEVEGEETAAVEPVCVLGSQLGELGEHDSIAGDDHVGRVGRVGFAAHGQQICILLSTVVHHGLEGTLLGSSLGFALPLR